MICKKCGKEIDDNSTNCQYCGEKVEMSEENIENEIQTDEKHGTPKRFIIAFAIVVIANIILGLLYLGGESSKDNSNIVATDSDVTENTVTDKVVTTDKVTKDVVTKTKISNKELQEVSFVFGYVSSDIHNSSLKEFCSGSGYLPTQYMKLHEDAFKNTKAKVIAYIDENVSEKDKKVFTNKEVINNAKQEGFSSINDDFTALQQQYPELTKKEYCKIYDTNKDLVIDAKVKKLQQVKPGWYVK